MMKKKVLVITGVAFALMVIFVCINLIINNTPPKAADNEIMVNIQLDIDEDIGLFLIDYDVNESAGEGGISNADKTMIKKDSTDLYWTFNSEFLDNPVETAKVKLLFTIVTKYFTPNYENIYPEEYMIPLDPISFKANFGQIYLVTITGNKHNGYHATLVES